MIIVGLFLRKQMKTESKERERRDREHLEIDYLLAEVKDLVYQLSSSTFSSSSLAKETYERELNKRISLKKAIKSASSGSVEDKTYVVDFIRDILEQYLIKPDEVNEVLHFTKPNFLATKDKFDILLYVYEKEYGKKALAKLMETYQLDKEREVMGENDKGYVIHAEQIIDIYDEESPSLSTRDKYYIIAQRIYEKYLGFGAVDKIRDMDIDGVSGGVSGLINLDIEEPNLALENADVYPHNYDSVWIFYRGKSIHLAFLGFGSDRELRRVCQNIYKYNKAGQLAESNGYKVNEMKDGSRVVVVRPPFAESWAFFVRKFHIKRVELEDLIKGEDTQVVIGTLRYLMKGARITSITGSQGTGKTTLLMAMIRYIYPALTLRIQEMAFELNLRKVYPMRNILTFQETEYIAGQEGLDLQKKTDGAVNILGEIATDEVSVLMLQMAQVASLFTVFTHHAKTVKDLVLSLRNSLLKCNVFRDEQIAEQQVIQVLNFDVHLSKDYAGNRYIERISEIIPIKNDGTYNRTYKDATTAEEKMEAFMDTMVDYFQNRTGAKCYESVNIIEYHNGRYIPKARISDDQIEAMKLHMTSQDALAFATFIEKTWGGKTENEPDLDSIYSYS